MASNEGVPVTENQPPPSARTAYDAVIFDMDGVVTDTASVHAGAWKALFDEVLPGLAGSPGPAAPFDVVADYRRSVDGRPREDGVRTFLASRGITLPEDGPPGQLTVAGLAARKQALFEARLAAGGARAIPGTVALLHRLREQGIPTAVVTSSRNSARVLAAAAVADLFDVCVDGNDALRMRLAGKPDPAIFLEAARQLRVDPGRVVVIEDAESGVQSAVRGGFGLVVGLDRAGYGDRLRAAGADLVVADLSDLDLADLQLGELDLAESLAHELPGWAGGDAGSDPWLLRYDGFDPATEGLREALCTLGNGYWGTRGAAAEADADAVHYPGTYLAGVYNRLRTDLGTRVMEDESMVNAPNWLPLWFKVGNEDWFRPDTARLLSYRQELDLRRGLLTRVIRFADDAGRTRAFEGTRPLAPARQFLRDDAGWVAHEFELHLAPGHPVRVEKVVIVNTSRDRAIVSAARAVTTWIQRLADPARLLRAHEREWQILWDEFAVHLQASERASLALNLNTFHVLQTMAAVDADLDAGVPARGLHGEGYRGLVFWDELFVYPILTLRRPDLSRALLGYRYRRLNEARAAAKSAGFEGANCRAS